MITELGQDRLAEARILELLPATAARIRRPEEGRVEVRIVGTEAANLAEMRDSVRTLLLAEFDLDPQLEDIHVLVQEPKKEKMGATERRLLFRSVNVYREGARADVQVELTDGAQRLLGTASGPAFQQSLGKLVASATLAAVGRRLSENQAVDLVALERSRLGSRRVMICHLMVCLGREERHLTGSALVTNDPLEATVFSILDALNRILPGLSTAVAGDDWVEYEVEAAR